MNKNGRKAFFFDRDGVINIDHGYVSKIKDFTFVDGIFPVMRALAAKGYALIVVTNQSGIGRGYYTKKDFQTLTGWMLERFTEEGIQIAAVYSCPHSPELDCDCRKPAPGMFLQAIRELGIDPSVSWMIGDKPSDMAAAAAAGISNRVLLGEAVSSHSTNHILKLSELINLPV
jgi:D-glycero-D-manno-heptose 1,7-bisphosphate phosphatase